ncbi:MAG: ribulose-phosphate 3-epimerase [bacterium]|nr:ribulose-phosphate 3-epimerase [bacterium]
MLVIPAINEIEFSEVLKKINIAGEFSRWIHLDVVDGKFAANTTWNNPGDLKAINSGLKADIEVHLMVENPEVVIKDWVSAGAKRIIISLEALEKSKLQFKIQNLFDKNCEIGLAINPETSVEKLIPFISINQPEIGVNQRLIKFVLVLGVSPGLAGQKLNENVLEKIKFLKNYYPGVIIEADGGIDLETAKLAKEAGVDIIVSASYIFGSPNPQKAYEDFLNI